MLLSPFTLEPYTNPQTRNPKFVGLTEASLKSHRMDRGGFPLDERFRPESLASGCLRGLVCGLPAGLDPPRSPGLGLQVSIANMKNDLTESEAALIADQKLAAETRGKPAATREFRFDS